MFVARALDIFGLVGVIGIGGAGAFAGWAFARLRGGAPPTSDPSTASLTRLEAHLASAPAMSRITPASSASLRREAQEVFEAKEAGRDLQVLDQLLRDIRDLSNADEAIFWRWVEARQTLVPGAWSTEGAQRPRFFDMRSSGPLVRWSAEQAVLQFAGDVDGAPSLAAAPVMRDLQVCGVLTLTAGGGLRPEDDASRAWLVRFAAQVGSLIQLFDVRREYGRHMRESGALLDAVKRLQGHSSAAKLAEALCDTAREVTSAPSAGLVRWNAAERHGVVQSVSSGTGLEAGFHVTPDSLVGRACVERLPVVLEDANAATGAQCPYGGLPREVGSVAIVPVLSGDQVIGALVVEGSAAAIGRHEASNVALLAAVARSPLEIGWEIEEVSRRARTDSLTGLANRRHFDESLRRVVLETDRFGGTCSLILIDLDHFKRVNDQYGHEAGDAVLKQVAQTLSDVVRTVDLCARYGGEEIAILLPQTSEAGAAELADRLRITITSRPVRYGGGSIPVSASFGVATYPVPVPYGGWLVPAADKALYEAKAAGRNCVKIIRPTHVTAELYKNHG